MRASLLWPALLLALSCSEDCHEVDCGTTLIVELSSEDWLDGAHEVVIDAGADSTTCGFVLNGGQAEQLACSLAAVNLDPSELEQGYMLIKYREGEPTELSVTVSRDGEELAQGELTPVYEELVLDPQACGGPCLAAQVSLDVP